MAVFNPFYNEETGHIPLDELAPWQQALMNPGANNPGMSMPGMSPNTPYYQFTQFNPLQPGALPSGYDPYAISNGIAGVYNGSNLTGSNQGGSTNPGGPMPNDPFTFQGAGGGPPNSTAGNDAFNNVFNRGTTPRTSNNPPIIGSPQLATNMGMTGAENVGGVGMYTGANGPLDLTRFTPVQNTPPPGAPPGSIPTGDPNTWITPWGATYTTPGAINNQSSADYDAYRQRAFGNMMGPQGAGPQSNPYSELTDALVRQPGSINAQTFQGYLNSLQGQQTGPYPPQQTAPLPPQYPPGQIGNQPGGRDFIADMYAQLEAERQASAQREQQRLSGIQAAQQTTNPYQEQYAQQLNQRLAQLGLRTVPSTGMRTQEFRADPLGLGIDTRDVAMLDGSPVDWNRLVAQYGRNAFSGWGTDLQRQAQDFYSNLISPYYQNTGGLNRTPVIGSPGMMGPQGYGNGQMQVDPYRTGGLDPGPGGGQPNYQQMAAQFSSDPATQQAYLNDMLRQSAYGAGYNPQEQYLTPNGIGALGGQMPQVDFRAATFGGGSLFPANTGSGGNGTGSGTNTNIPNTTNPVNTQYSAPGFGGATNRRSSWGSGMSLFGNQFGGGQSPFYAGPGNNLPAYSGGGPSGSYTAPEYREYRGAGTYGRPASYGQSQRPY